MDEDTKRKFDAFVSIRDHEWREFKEKTSVEWRLSFGIWSAVLASAAALIAADPRPHINKDLLLVILVATGILHFGFLWWIQTKLGKAREILYKAQMDMSELLNIPVAPYSRNMWMQPLWIELAITFLVTFVLFEIIAA